MEIAGKVAVVSGGASGIGRASVLAERSGLRGGEAGLVNFSRSLAHLADASRIRVNTICPELVDTPMARTLGEERLADLRRVGGILTPEAIAAGVQELIEDESRFGAVLQITIGGGMAYVTPSLASGGLQYGEERSSPTMSDERVRAVMVRYYEEIWNQGRLEVCDELIAPDYVNHSAPQPGLPPGPAGLKQIVAGVRHAFPDLHYTIEDLVLGREKAALRVTMRGTHRGEFLGVAPTGRQVEVQEIQIEHLRDGQIVAHWHLIDDLRLQRQLGLPPHHVSHGRGVE